MRRRWPRGVPCHILSARHATRPATTCTHISYRRPAGTAARVTIGEGGAPSVRHSSSRAASCARAPSPRPLTPLPPASRSQMALCALPHALLLGLLLVGRAYGPRASGCRVSPGKGHRTRGRGGGGIRWRRAGRLLTPTVPRCLLGRRGCYRRRAGLGLGLELCAHDCR